eukprot:Rhum_TRINITY_DN14393_c9_g1::Rhum_TRINITY_DN14393_c9_g1_i1::g.80397::m.80397
MDRRRAVAGAAQQQQAPPSPQQPPRVEVSVNVRDATRAGEQCQLFAISERPDAAVSCGVVASRSFTSAHQPKYTFEFDRVFPPAATAATIYDHSVRHALHAAMRGSGGGGDACVVTCGPHEPLLTHLDLLCSAAREATAHAAAAAAGFSVRLSVVAVTGGGDGHISDALPAFLGFTPRPPPAGGGGGGAAAAAAAAYVSKGPVLATAGGVRQRQ